MSDLPYFLGNYFSCVLGPAKMVTMFSVRWIRDKKECVLI